MAWLAFNARDRITRLRVLRAILVAGSRCGSRRDAFAVGVHASLDALDERARADVAEAGELRERCLVSGLAGGIDRWDGQSKSTDTSVASDREGAQREEPRGLIEPTAEER